jgi:hypothetical protein
MMKPSMVNDEAAPTTEHGVCRDLISFCRISLAYFTLASGGLATPFC